MVTTDLHTALDDRLKLVKILTERPPNWEAIADVFMPWNIQNAVFTYGDTVYNPNGYPLSEDLKAHEAVHVERQQMPEAWWTLYLHDPVFRMREELMAYQAQYAYAVKNYNRQRRKVLLNAIAKDLAGPMYGRLMTKDEAKDLIANQKQSAVQ